MSSVAVLLEVRRCQAAIPEILTRENGCTFGHLFDQLGLTDGGRIDGTSHDRVLDKALQGLRRHGDIRFNRKRGVWEKVAASEQA